MTKKHRIAIASKLQYNVDQKITSKMGYIIDIK